MSRRVSAGFAHNSFRSRDRPRQIRRHRNPLDRPSELLELRPADVTLVVAHTRRTDPTARREDEGAEPGRRGRRRKGGRGRVGRVQHRRRDRSNADGRAAHALRDEIRAPRRGPRDRRSASCCGADVSCARRQDLTQASRRARHRVHRHTVSRRRRAARGDLSGHRLFDGRPRRNRSRLSRAGLFVRRRHRNRSRRRRFSRRRFRFGATRRRRRQRRTQRRRARGVPDVDAGKKGTRLHGVRRTRTSRRDAIQGGRDRRGFRERRDADGGA